MRDGSLRKVGVHFNRQYMYVERKQQQRKVMLDSFHLNAQFYPQLRISSTDSNIRTTLYSIRTYNNYSSLKRAVLL